MKRVNTCLYLFMLILGMFILSKFQAYEKIAI